MAATNFSLLSFSLCFSLLCHGLMAQLFSQGISPWQSSRRGGLTGCRFDQLHAFEPQRRMQSQAGVTEHFDMFNEQFRCAGVSVVRRIIEPRGLLLPQYSNAPSLVYIVQGSGITGPTFPGCPETYQQQFQQFEQAEEAEGQGQSHKFRDEHQKIHRFRQGDVLALPAGVAHWCYNDGDAPVVALCVSDVSNGANQLDPRQREFLLAGNNKRAQQTYERWSEELSGENIFRGFSVELLSEALGVSTAVAKRLQSQNDQRGEIVRVEHGLQLLKPSAAWRQQEQERTREQYQPGQYQKEPSFGGQYNGLDESFCSMKVRQNIDNPDRADTYNPRAGRITRLNSQKFPILNLIQMSAVKVNLYQNAILSPFWNINAHSVMYVTQGRVRVQVVNNLGRTVFNGELRRGQLLIIPQNFAVLKKAEREGCMYVAFKTNLNSMVSQIAGKNSVFRGLPVNVLANAYRLSREEALRLKHNRGDESGVFAPRYDQGRNPSLVEEEESKPELLQGAPKV